MDSLIYLMLVDLVQVCQRTVAHRNPLRNELLLVDYRFLLVVVRLMLEFHSDWMCTGCLVQDPWRAIHECPVSVESILIQPNYDAKSTVEYRDHRDNVVYLHNEPEVIKNQIIDEYRISEQKKFFIWRIPVKSMLMIKSIEITNLQSLYLTSRIKICFIKIED